MIDLLYLARDHDLPPSWDGHRIEWEGWQGMPPVFVCPPPKPQPCRSCGSLEPAIFNAGLFRSRDRRSGREQNNRLAVVRCPDCRTDAVMDRNGDWWDLDPSDYTDDGSRVLR